MSETAQSQKAKPAEQKQAKPAEEKKPAAEAGKQTAVQKQPAKTTQEKTSAAEKPEAEAPETEEQKAAGGFRQKVEKAISRKEEAKEPKVLETRVYTIPLREVKNTSRLRRAKRAVSYVQEFIKKHMKTEDVKMSAELNEILWARGIRYVPSSIKVQALKTEKYVTLKPSE